MIDIHSHTKYSADSEQCPRKLVKEAIDKGCRILGFSEHLDYDYVVNNVDVVMTDVAAYYNNALLLKKEFNNKIILLCGIEFGYDKNAEEYYKAVSKQYDFDYIINSVHLVEGKDCYFADFFIDKTKEYAYTKYLEAVLSSVYAEFDYQVIGHLGYVVRNATYKDKYLYYKEYSVIIDQILQAIIEKQKVLEINTNINYDKTDTLPDTEILKRYYQLGGRLVTFSSDCHSAERVCSKYRQTINTLKEIGFDKLAYFINKKIMFYDI
ncbi:MAG: histidinol-phosphatase HisJ family protein [Clostridia bacterium]|nr:histidinol-phosphatase HisJ family protein [Clostridia bacterium]